MERPSHAPPRVSRARRVLWGVAAVALTVLSLAWVWHRFGLDRARLVAVFAGADGGLVAAAFVVSFAATLGFGGFKLRVLARGAGIDLGLRDATRLWLGFGSARALMPPPAAEALVSVFLRNRRQVPLGRAVGVLLVDRVISLVAVLLLLAAGLALDPAAALGGTGLAMAGVALLAGLGLLFVGPVQGVVARVASRVPGRAGAFLAESLVPLRAQGHPRMLALLLLGALFQARFPLVCAILLRAHGAALPAAPVLAGSSAALLGGLAPGFVAGAGPREATFLLVLQGRGVAPDVLFATAVLMTLSLVVVPALVGLPWAFWAAWRARV